MTPPRLLAVLALMALPGAALAAPAFDDQRLFTTAAERQRLEELRAAGADAAKRETAADAAGETAARRSRVEPRKLPPVELRGFVRRSDGPGAVWVNDGSTVDDAPLPDDIRVRSGRLDGATAVVTLPDGRTVRLKPGQTWDPDTGRVVDSYER